MPENTLDPWQWGMIVVLFAIVLTLIAKFYGLLIGVWRERHADEGPKPYDYQHDNGLLDAWARDDEGELLVSYPADWEIKWRYK